MGGHPMAGNSKLSMTKKMGGSYLCVCVQMVRLRLRLLVRVPVQYNRYSNRKLNLKKKYPSNRINITNRIDKI